MSYYSPYATGARLKLTITSPPQSFTEPVSVTQAKEWCEIPAADTTRNDLMTTLIVAARELAELRQGRDLVEKQWDLTLNGFSECIELRDNASSIDLVEYRDSAGNWTTVSAAGYILDTAQNILIPPYSESWPSFTAYPSSAVLVRYTVTPPAVETQVLMGMRFCISMWFNNRIPVSDQASAVQNYPFCLGLLDHGKVERV